MGVTSLNRRGQNAPCLGGRTIKTATRQLGSAATRRQPLQQIFRILRPSLWWCRSSGGSGVAAPAPAPASAFPALALRGCGPGGARAETGSPSGRRDFKAKSRNPPRGVTSARHRARRFEEPTPKGTRDSKRGARFSVSSASQNQFSRTPPSQAAAGVTSRLPFAEAALTLRRSNHAAQSRVLATRWVTSESVTIENKQLRGDAAVTGRDSPVQRTPPLRGFATPPRRDRGAIPC